RRRVCYSPGCMSITTLGLTLAIVCVGIDAGAQTRVGGAVGVSTQADGDNDLPYLGLPFGGTTVGIVGAIDHDLSRHLALGGEVSTAGVITGAQSQRASGATNAFVSSHRDTVMSAAVKFGGPIGSRVRIAAMGGGGAAYRHTSRDGTTASLLPPASRA